MISVLSPTLKDIDTFCRRNNCSINVYDINGGKDDQEDDYEIDIEGDQEVDEISEDGMDNEDDIVSNVS